MGIGAELMTIEPCLWLLSSTHEDDNILVTKEDKPHHRHFPNAIGKCKSDSWDQKPVASALGRSSPGILMWLIS
ncbi:hypothetical protein Tdes44962_MAKER04493 [Teratosphaeria destructans]|uniref:Uncharacterized protein n=1 Tax=Teratosphaeria destructans TaxID=418781 RepID=A0A9W7SMB2_9PEZI|nr:hypothetical protein Tdes44962_MAKER04493 [Teratosphaeria destructans]